jgi:hypothetical protein
MYSFLTYSSLGAGKKNKSGSVYSFERGQAALPDLFLPSARQKKEQVRKHVFLRARASRPS